MKYRVIPALVLFSLAFSLAPSAAKAADPPAAPAAARGLFYEGRKLMAQYRWTEACPKLEESLRLDPGAGTEFNLAECNEHLGKLATAWAGFVHVAVLSKAANQAEREKVARRRALALEARLPNLVIEVSSAPQGLAIERDGVALGTSAWNTPGPVDPGPHRVSVTVPGRLPWEATVEVAERTTVRVSIPADLPSAPAPAPAPARAVVSTIPRPPPVEPATTTTTTAADVSESFFPPPVIENTGRRQRTLGWVLTGIGAAGLGAGAAFGVGSLVKRGASRDHCVVNTCDAAGIGLRSEAIQLGTVATIATIAGGAAAVGGLIFILTAPTSSGSPRGSGQARGLPSSAVIVGATGVTLEGAF